jgi:ABC-2 type transport system permease protein
VRELVALVGKELAILFGSPMAYLTLTLVALVTSLLFFDYLRAYNQILFVYSSQVMGGFETGTIPDQINVQDQVFVPLMEQLALTLIGLIPLVTMRVFAEERARGTDELLMTTLLSPTQIVVGKFAATYLFVALLLGVSFVYPAASIWQAGLGGWHLAAVYLGLLFFGFGVASIGLVCSAFTASQLVAAISAYAAAFVLYDFGWARQFASPAVARALSWVELHGRFASFAEGLVPIADLVFFVGVGLVGAALARLSLDLVRVR